MDYIVSVGEMLIDLVPQASEAAGEARAVRYVPHPGGAPANVAVAVARLGGAVRFVGALSTDALGRQLMQVLDEHGIDTRFTLTTPAPTGLALVTLGEHGQRDFTIYLQGTSLAALRAADLDPGAWKDAVICHTGGVLLALEPPCTAILHAMEDARRAGALVSFDANVRLPIWASEADLREQLREAVCRTDILKFSDDEAGYLLPEGEHGGTLRDDARLRRLGARLLELGPRLLVATRGASGALLMTPEQTVLAPSPPVEPVDTTGAGDAFMGALLRELVRLGCHTRDDLRALDGATLQSIGAFANRVAGMSCTRYGGIASLPWRAEVEEE